MTDSQKVAREIEQIAAEYENHTEAELEELFEKEWWRVEKEVAPVRGDPEFWKNFKIRMVDELIKNSDVVGATLGVITSHVLTELVTLGIDLSDFKIPIGILVAIIARSVWHALEEKNKKSR